jgi:hypothetical protein
MSINHITMRQAEEHYELHKERFDKLDSRLGDDYYKEANSRYTALLDFASVVRKEMRVHTIPRTDNTMHIYRKGELMMMGYIGYGDFATSVHGEDKYIVCARGIENMKYCASGDQHNMRMSVNIDTAVKHAKRSFQNYSIYECAKALVGGVKNSVQNVINAKEQKCQEAIAAVGMNTTSYGDAKKATQRLMAEIRSMVQAGHTFNDKELDADIRAMFTLTEDRKLFSEVVPMNFVHVTERYGQQVVDCARIKDVTNYMAELDTVQTFAMDEVPEDMEHKCAALSICEDGHFVEGVGQRINDHTFYLYV